MTFSVSTADLNNALATLVFNPTPDYNGGAARVDFTVADGAAPHVVKSVPISVTQVVDVVDDAVTTPEDVAITFNAITGTNGASADKLLEQRPSSDLGVPGRIRFGELRRRRHPHVHAFSLAEGDSWR